MQGIYGSKTHIVGILDLQETFISALFLVGIRVPFLGQLDHDQPERSFSPGLNELSDDKYLVVRLFDIRGFGVLLDAQHFIRVLCRCFPSTTGMKWLWGCVSIQ